MVKSPQDDIKNLEELLASGRSATAFLQDFCATPLRVVQLSCDTFPLPEKLFFLTSSGPKEEQLSFRHIYLYADDVLLMEAWNCFNPLRLAPSLQSKLTGSTIPFGALLGEHSFTRDALETHHPSPLKPYRLAHQALLRRLPDRKPLALVYEHYTENALRILSPEKTNQSSST